MDLDSITILVKNLIQDIRISVEDTITPVQEDFADTVLNRLVNEYEDSGTITISIGELRDLLATEQQLTKAEIINGIYSETSYFENENTGIIKDIKQNIQEFEEEYDAVVRELEDTKSDLADADNKIEELEDELDQTKAELKEISRILDACQGKL